MLILFGTYSPVLSEQISLTAPSASIESSLRTMTWRAAMRFVLTAKVIVKTTMRDAGIMHNPALRVSKRRTLRLVERTSRNRIDDDDAVVHEPVGCRDDYC